MNRTTAVVYSLGFIGLRVYLLYGFLASSSLVALPFVLSEVFALIVTSYSLRVGCVDRGSLLVPVFYMVPLLFVTSGAEVVPAAVPILYGLCLLQVLVRFILGTRLTVGNPVFLSVCDVFPYSLVRHPLAVLEACIAVAVFATFPSVRNACIACACAAAFSAAALIEERFLTGFFEYRRYADRVRWRFLPGVC